MTGMGTYIALLLAAGIGDISRFAGPKNPVSWPGLSCAISMDAESDAITAYPCAAFSDARFDAGSVANS